MTEEQVLRLEIVRLQDHLSEAEADKKMLLDTVRKQVVTIETQRLLLLACEKDVKVARKK